MRGDEFSAEAAWNLSGSADVDAPNRSTNIIHLLSDVLLHSSGNVVPRVLVHCDGAGAAQDELLASLLVRSMDDGRLAL